MLPSRLPISMDIVRQMVAHAESTYPLECAGIVAQDCDDGIFMDRVPTGQTSATGFSIEAQQIMRLEKQSSRILGFYHSHPDAPSQASRNDRAAMQMGQSPLWPGVFWCILSVRDGQCIDLRTYLWNPTQLKFDVIQVAWPQHPTIS